MTEEKFTATDYITELRSLGEGVFDYNGATIDFLQGLAPTNFTNPNALTFYALQIQSQASIVQAIVSSAIPAQHWLVTSKKVKHQNLIKVITHDITHAIVSSLHFDGHNPTDFQNVFTDTIRDYVTSYFDALTEKTREELREYLTTTNWKYIIDAPQCLKLPVSNASVSMQALCAHPRHALLEKNLLLTLHTHYKTALNTTGPIAQWILHKPLILHAISVLEDPNSKDNTNDLWTIGRFHSSNLESRAKTTQITPSQARWCIQPQKTATLSVEEAKQRFTTSSSRSSSSSESSEQGIQGQSPSTQKGVLTRRTAQSSLPPVIHNGGNKEQTSPELQPEPTPSPTPEETAQLQTLKNRQRANTSSSTGTPPAIPKKPANLQSPSNGGSPKGSFKLADQVRKTSSTPPQTPLPQIPVNNSSSSQDLLTGNDQVVKASSTPPQTPLPQIPVNNGNNPTPIASAKKAPPVNNGGYGTSPTAPKKFAIAPKKMPVPTPTVTNGYVSNIKGQKTQGDSSQSLS